MTPEPDPAAPPVPVPSIPHGASVRCGVDVVSIGRIAGILEEFGDSFRERTFTPAERRYCDGRGDPPQHYAARWAAKEAFVKAVVPEAPTVPFRDVGVRRDGEEPTLALTDPARDALDATVASEGWHPDAVECAVSLSHDRGADRAIGQVVLFGVAEP